MSYLAASYPAISASLRMNPIHPRQDNANGTIRVTEPVMKMMDTIFFRTSKVPPPPTCYSIETLDTTTEQGQFCADLAGKVEAETLKHLQGCSAMTDPGKQAECICWPGGEDGLDVDATPEEARTCIAYQCKNEADVEAAMKSDMDVSEIAAQVCNEWVPKIKNGEKLPDPEGAAPETEDSASETESSASKAEDSAPKTEESAPKTEDSASKTENSVPKAEDSGAAVHVAWSVKNVAVLGLALSGLLAAF